MASNGKDTKHTSHITRRKHFVINGEDCNFHKMVWCEGGLQLADIGTKNSRWDEFNPRLGYAMVRLESWHNTCTIGVIGYRRVWITMCSKWLNWIELSIQINEF